VEAGFADSMAEPVKIAASFDVTRFRNAPPEVVEGLARPDNTETQDKPQTATTSISSAATPPTGDPPAVPGAPDLTTARTEAMAYARAVVDLCRLAGQPQMAAGFLEREAPLEEVRAALLTARAEADPEISAHHPQPGPNPSARPWADVINRTFKRKG
jgi:hypothetical protein